MKKQKIWCRIASFCLAAALVAPTASAAPAGLNSEAISKEYLYAGMELESEAAAVQEEVSDEGGTAALWSDRKAGLASLKVTSGRNSRLSNSQYTLLSGDAFSLTDCSSIDLWIKPGAGADWIEFYIDNELIKSDADSDGRYMVNTELQSGVWQHIRLNLLNTENSIGTAEALKVHTNVGATWLYDEIVGTGISASAIDLSAMVNSNTEIRTGRLEFKKNSDSGFYESKDSVLISNSRVLFEKTFDTANDFNEGTITGAITTSSGVLNVGRTNLCVSGTAICGKSGSSYPASNAFDSSETTFWYSGSSTSPSYIGYQFAQESSVYGVYIHQDLESLSNVAVQYYDQTTSKWVDICTVPFATSENKKTVIFDQPVSAKKFCVTGSEDDIDNAWYVYDLQFMGESGQYISPAMDISTTEPVLSGMIDLGTDDKATVLLESSVSYNGGTSWGEWTEVKESGELNEIFSEDSLANARLRFRVALKNIKNSDAARMDKISVYTRGVRSNELQLVDGAVSGINVIADVRDIDGNPVDVVDEFEVPVSTSTAKLSGDGTVLYYTNSDKELYRADLRTGYSARILENYTYYSSMNVSFDGSKACFLLKKKNSGIGPNTHAVVVYNANGESQSKELGVGTAADFPKLYMSDGGNVLYAERTDSDTGTYKVVFYDSQKEKSTKVYTGTGETSFKDCPIYMSEDGKTVYAQGNVRYTQMDDIWSEKKLDITYTIMSKDLKKAYYVDSSSSISYEYDIETGISKRLDIDVATVKKTLDDGRLVLWSDSTLTIYDPNTGDKEKVLSAEEMHTSISFRDVSSDGSAVAYKAGTDGKSTTKIKNLEKESELKFLLSFDNENSWYRYKNGAWENVYTGSTPSADLLKEKGMTQAEVNALKQSNFAPLYASGADIYSVDVAVGFFSSNPNVTPSIGAIYILAEQKSALGNAAGTFIANSVDFAGAGWRKIDRIYPIEISPLSAEYTYFIYAGEKYSTYNGTWYTESNGEITNLLKNVEENWTTLQLKGMSAQQVRTIPAEVLSQNLAYKDFSVVYCVKIKDASEEGYYSKISVDYTADMFTGTTLSLQLVMADGTENVLSGLADTVVEDFMTWYTTYPAHRGSNVYQIKQGTKYFFVNHDLIQSISVTEG